MIKKFKEFNESFVKIPKDNFGLTIDYFNRMIQDIQNTD